MYFGDSSEQKIIGVANLCKNSSTFIENDCLFNNLKHNFLSISQLSDKCYKVIFDKSNQNILLRAHMMVKLSFLEKRCMYVYIIEIDCALSHDECFSTLHDDSWLCHRRLGHACMDLISRI